MPEKQPIYLIDGSAYIYRAYHAIAPLSNSSGMPTHAVFGFANILLKVLRDKQPEFMAMVFDAKGPNFRHELYADYKANRPPMPDDLIPQIPYIKELSTAYNILTLEMPGFEADDIIASAARVLTDTGHPVIVVSGDKDLLQLVTEDITVWDPMKDVIMDGPAVEKKYNVPPERLLDFFALMGDKSDNVPGVPGVGPKTAGKLIAEFGSLEGLYENIAGLKKSKLKDNLVGHRDEAFMSKRLIDLRSDLAVPARLADYRIPAPDPAKLKELYTELGFTRLLKSEVPAEAVSREGFALVCTEAELERLAGLLQAAPLMVLDTETTGLDTLVAELVGLSFCVDPEQTFYVPMGHRTGEGDLAAGQLPRETVLARLRPLLEDPAIAKVGHNLKFDYSILLNCGIKLAGDLCDTMIASYLLDPSRRTHKLDDLCREFLDLAMTSFAEVTNKDKRADSFAYVSLEDARDYSCEDVVGSLGLWRHFEPQLREQGLEELFHETEAPLVPILAGMERAGIIVDPDILAGMSEEFSAHLAELETEIFRQAGEEFNINSPRQLGEILFGKLGLPHGRKTKTGYSTDVKVLERLAHHDIVRAIMAHRNLTKLKNTYVDKLAGLIHPKTGRVHTSFNQTITATGRLSSSNPNLQNIPIRTEEGQRIRRAFVAAPGHVFLAGDYSQIDLRVLAHYSQDKVLLEAFRSGQDIHNQTAAEIYMVSPLLVTAEMRRAAKTINFGIVYGMSSFGLAEQLKVSRQSAQVFIDRYFDCYAGVRVFMADIIRQAKETGYVTTLLNRRRVLPDINSPNRNRREFAERTAINTPIQGTAADIIKLAMIEADKTLKEKGLKARMLLQIHDELVFEVPENEVEQTRDLVKQAMESVMELDVPLTVNLAVAGNLAKV